jgi:hypothetical protein
MSIAGAIAELNKEIDRLNKEVERLTKTRDSLSHGYVGVIPPIVTQPPVEQKTIQGKRKYTRSAKPLAKTAANSLTPAKKSVAKKASTAPTTVPAGKRVMSAATRKKMSDSAKARAAAKAEATK